MSDNKPMNWEDDSLESLLRGAYDSVEPSPEAEERMLRAVMAAAKDAGASQPSTSGETAQGAPEKPASRTTPAPKRAARGGKGWRIAAAIVAVVVLVGAGVGVGLGAGLLGSGPASNAAPVVASGDAAAKSGANPAASGAPAEASAAHRQDAEANVQYDMAATGAADSTAGEEDMVVEPGGTEGAFSTEEYGHVVENRFVATATSPLSTVSADVDTASYCNVRRLVAQGSSVPAGAVRIEEMLNYFAYDYAAPVGDEQFATTVQVAPCPWNDQTQLMVLGFATPKVPQHATEGSNLVFLIDISGSMNSVEKLPLLKDAFAVLTSQLGENDRVSIVTYAAGEEVVLEGASGTDARTIQRAIDQLRARGATNGEAGLKMAYEVAERNYIEGGVNRVIMASDGDLNVGMTSESELYSFVDSKRATGVYLSVLGFGSGNYKDNKMEVLADHGNGNYHYIDSLEEAQRVFGTKLLANVVPFADNVKVQVEFNPVQVKAYRLIGYENRVLAAEDFRDDAVDAGDVGPNSQFTVAYEIVPVGSAFEVDVPELHYGSATAGPADADGTDSGELAMCTLRWRAFADGEMHEQSTPVDASVVTDAPSADWKMAAAVVEFGMLLRGSSHAGTSSYDAAIDLVEQAKAASEGALASERQGLGDLVAKAARVAAAE